MHLADANDLRGELLNTGMWFVEWTKQLIEILTGKLTVYRLLLAE